MKPFELRTLCRSGLKVTQLGFGAAPVGDLYQRLSDDQAVETIRAAYAAGVRYFDSAPLYGFGLSEHRVGYALRHHPRESFVLSTKVGRTLQARPKCEFDHGMWAGGLNFHPVFDYSYDGVMRSFEDSLQRLGTDHVETLAIHDLDLIHHRTSEEVDRRFRELTGGLKALRELLDSGVIRGFGAGANQLEYCRRFADMCDLDFFLIAGRYTLLEQPALDDVLPLCAERNISVTVAAPFNSGILASGSVAAARYDYQLAPPEILLRVKRIEAVCREHAVPLAAAALQFPLAHPVVKAVIPGTVSVREVSENVFLMRRSIPPQFWQQLKSEGLLRPDAPVPGAKA
ncbi:MAG: aldo/keto reductase [Acidobacteriota bacterium]